MSIFDFKKRFSGDLKLEEIRKDFVNKINHFLFREINKRNYYEYPKLFEFICLQLSLNADDILREVNANNISYHYGGGDLIYPSPRYFTRDDFQITLLLIEIIYSYFSVFATDNYRKEEYLARINSAIEIAMDQPLSLGIVWRDGRFYPEGAKDLTEKLVSDVLVWLADFPKASSLYKNALDHYSQSLKDYIKRKDVISNAFQAVEELTRIFLKNDKAFDNNFEELVEKLKLNSHWKQILNRYKEISKEFGRHPGRAGNFIPDQEDTEAFLYLSGLLMRLMLEKLSKQIKEVKE